MADDSLSATTIIEASAESIFGVLVEPAKHAEIDGTGWVGEPVDGRPLTAAGQIFRMAMFHPNHPDKNYQTVNCVETFDPPRAIAWRPGYDTDDGGLGFGGWVWRYDLTAIGESRTHVTLSYDWSAVPDDVRQHIGFPPFSPDHLDNSLAHLAALVSS